MTHLARSHLIGGRLMPRKRRTKDSWDSHSLQ